MNFDHGLICSYHQFIGQVPHRSNSVNIIKLSCGISLEAGLSYPNKIWKVVIVS